MKKGVGGDGQVERRNSVLFAAQQIITTYHPAWFARVRTAAKGWVRNILFKQGAFQFFAFNKTERGSNQVSADI